MKCNPSCHTTIHKKASIDIKTATVHDATQAAKTKISTR